MLICYIVHESLNIILYQGFQTPPFQHLCPDNIAPRTYLKIFQGQRSALCPYHRIFTGGADAHRLFKPSIFNRVSILSLVAQFRSGLIRSQVKGRTEGLSLLF